MEIKIKSKKGSNEFWVTKNCIIYCLIWNRLVFNMNDCTEYATSLLMCKFSLLGKPNNNISSFLDFGMV